MAPSVADIDWAAVDTALLLDHSPEIQAQRKQQFKSMSFSKNKHLSHSECDAGVPLLLQGDFPDLQLIIPDLRPPLKHAYITACRITPTLRKNPKRGKKQHHARHGSREPPPTIDLAEFHALLLSFRQYLQLAVMFIEIDHSHMDDKMLSYKECERCLPLLAQWDISEEDVKGKFPNEWDSTMKYHDFAEWCIRCHFKHRFDNMGVSFDDHGDIDEDELKEVMKKASDVDGYADGADEECQARVLDLFMQWDSDNSGGITEAEFSDILTRLNPAAYSSSHLKKLFEAADTSKDGKVDYKEFIAWLFQK